MRDVNRQIYIHSRGICLIFYPHPLGERENIIRGIKYGDKEEKQREKEKREGGKKRRKERKKKVKNEK